jgi:hypothetical protein
MKEALKQVKGGQPEGHVRVNRVGYDPDTGEPQVQVDDIPEEDFIRNGIGGGQDE